MNDLDFNPISKILFPVGSAYPCFDNTIDPNTFLYGILKRKPVPDRYKNLSFKEKLEKVKELAKKNKKRQKKPLFGAFEEKIFSQFFSQPIFSLLLETFQKKSDSPLLQFE